VPFAELIFWAAVVCCAVAEFAILRATATAPYVPPADPALPAVRRPVEIIWAVVPAIALAVVLWMTWLAIHTPRTP
jgi:hypothetical protein